MKKWNEKEDREKSKTKRTEKKEGKRRTFNKSSFSFTEKRENRQIEIVELCVIGCGEDRERQEVN